MKHDPIDIPAAQVLPATYSRHAAMEGRAHTGRVFAFATLNIALALVVVACLIQTDWIWSTTIWATAASETYAVLALCAWRARRATPGSPAAQARAREVDQLVSATPMLWIAVLAIAPHLGSYSGGVATTAAAAVALAIGVMTWPENRVARMGFMIGGATAAVYAFALVVVTVAGL